MSTRPVVVGFALATLLGSACSLQRDTPPREYEPRAPCADRSALRNVYFGDLHVHTRHSFDAYAFEVRTTPAQAYRFARGEAVVLPPASAPRNLRLARPLDFAAVTDHSEFLGEIDICAVPGSRGYATEDCVRYREGGNAATTQFGVVLTFPAPRRSTSICGPDLRDCTTRSDGVWAQTQRAANDVYDRSSACSFTTFIGYEYSGATGFSTLHRNVIFRNERVPPPVSYVEEPTPQGLWRQLRSTCLEGGRGCDVLAIPHNSNESNGQMFRVEYPGAETLAQQRAQARERAALEPLVEIYQHKSDSECMNGLSGILGAPDELCNFEKHTRTPFTDCGDGIGGGGIARIGCFSRRDFVRGALLEGLREDVRLGVNPFPLGIIASTDTHNGTPGAVAEEGFLGHRGTDDDTPAKQLGPGSLTPGGIEFSPGGLAAVWAEENSRSSIFAALRRREVYGTSGPRISVRFFGGWTYPGTLCTDPRLVEKGYAAGVPMGGMLPPRPGVGRAPVFAVSALRDAGLPERPGTPLQVVQIIKGWIGADGQAHQRIFDVAGNRHNGASVDTGSCVRSGPGADSLCAVFTDPEFDPGRPAVYYARVLENPTCRWSTYSCNRLGPTERPASCSDPAVPKTIQERAWTSPIWYRPPS